MWQPSDRFLHNVTVIDVAAGVARPDQSIVIREDRIYAVRDARRVRVPDDAYAALGAQLGRLHNAGVQLLTGSDTQNNCLVPGYSLHWELEQMVRVGLRPLDALRAATTTAAAAIGRQEDLGQIQPDYRADLVVLGADPLQRIENTRDIRGVMQNGCWYDEAALAKLRNDVSLAVGAAASGAAE